MQAFSMTVLGTLGALVVYVWATMGVGQARGKYGVKAPAITGNEDFERAFRAQQNTLEQLALFLPLVWIVASQFGDMWGGVYALVWIVGRTLYIVGYKAAADKRGTGFMIAGLASIAALATSIVGVVMDLMA